MNEERRESNALVVITAVGVVMGLFAGLLVGAWTAPELHRILALTASIVLFSSVTTGILIYRRYDGGQADVAEPALAAESIDIGAQR